MPSRGEREPRKHRSRTSQDLGYGGYDGQQGDGYEGGYGNDYGQERKRDKDRKENRGSRGYDHGLVKEKNAAAGRRYDVQAPDASIVLEGYRADILNGFEEPQARYNPVSCMLLLCEWLSRGNQRLIFCHGIGKYGASAKFYVIQYQRSYTSAFVSGDSVMGCEGV